MFVNLQLTTGGVIRFEQQIEIEGRSDHFSHHTQILKNIRIQLEELDRIDNHFYLNASSVMEHKEKNKRFVALNNNASVERYIDNFVNFNVEVIGRQLNYIPK